MLYNYRHLYYFWVVAKEGSMSRAAERLNIAIQTISAQVHELEKSLGWKVQILRSSGKLYIETSVTDQWTLDRQNQEGAELSSNL